MNSFYIEFLFTDAPLSVCIRHLIKSCAHFLLLFNNSCYAKELMLRKSDFLSPFEANLVGKNILLQVSNLELFILKAFSFRGWTYLISYPRKLKTCWNDSFKLETWISFFSLLGAKAMVAAADKFPYKICFEGGWRMNYTCEQTIVVIAVGTEFIHSTCIIPLTPSKGDFSFYCILCVTSVS